MPTRMKTSKKTVSVGYELETLRAALTAARLLVEGLWQDGFSTEENRQAAPQAVGGVLALVMCRVRDLERVLYRTLPARDFWAQHNAVPWRRATSDAPDLLLPVENPTDRFPSRTKNSATRSTRRSRS